MLSFWPWKCVKNLYCDEFSHVLLLKWNCFKITRVTLLKGIFLTRFHGEKEDYIFFWLNCWVYLDFYISSTRLIFLLLCIPNPNLIGEFLIPMIPVASSIKLKNTFILSGEYRYRKKWWLPMNGISKVILFNDLPSY